MAYEQPQPQLIIFDDEEGQKKLQVMELLPEEDHQQQHGGFIDQETYSGRQLLHDWAGELLYGYVYENGKKAALIQPTSKSGRTAWCTTYTRYYLSATCVNSGIWEVHATSVLVIDQQPLIYPPQPYGGDYFCSGWTVDYVTQEQQCYPDGTGGTPGPSPVYQVALEELRTNKTGLYGPCPGLTDAWRNLINFKPPQSVIDKLSRLAQNTAFMNTMDRPIENVPDSWFVQSIKNAEGIAINLDNFSVYFEAFPIVNGQRLDMTGTMNYVCTHINDFVDASHGAFSPHPATGTNEGAIWNSSNPVGAVLSIAIPLDQGSVICSQYTPGYQSAGWTFSTIHDPYNNDHPVSGNRVFGIYESGDGYVLYTQGADRLTGYADNLLGIASKAVSGQEL